MRDYCGITLPEGMKQHQKLWENLITPTTKSDEHDELISPKTIVKDGWMTQEEVSMYVVYVCMYVCKYFPPRK